MKGKEKATLLAHTRTREVPLAFLIIFGSLSFFSLSYVCMCWCVLYTALAAFSPFNGMCDNRTRKLQEEDESTKRNLLLS